MNPRKVAALAFLAGAGIGLFGGAFGGFFYGLDAGMRGRDAATDYMIDLGFGSGEEAYLRFTKRIAAQVELTRLRTGDYPEHLEDLDDPFLHVQRLAEVEGQPTVLEQLGYRRSADGAGWTLEPYGGVALPAGFWTGTGWREDV